MDGWIRRKYEQVDFAYVYFNGYFEFGSGTQAFPLWIIMSSGHSSSRELYNCTLLEMTNGRHVYVPNIIMCIDLSSWPITDYCRIMTSAYCSFPGELSFTDNSTIVFKSFSVIFLMQQPVCSLQCRNWKRQQMHWAVCCVLKQMAFFVVVFNVKGRSSLNRVAAALWLRRIQSEPGTYLMCVRCAHPWLRCSPWTERCRQ